MLFLISKVLINCIGPYALYGEPVVKACIEAGTHYVDVCGEPEFMEQMHLKYNQQAKDKGVYVISACGFDSIAADMGAVHFEKQFEGQVNSLESYLETWVEGGYFRTRGASIHYGTWESAVRSLSRGAELKELRAQIEEPPVPKVKPVLENRYVYTSCLYRKHHF